MQRLGAAFLIMAIAAGGAHAALPSAEQQADFFQTCMRIAENEPLCSCKMEAAPKLIDAEFMAVVISAMKGKAPDEKYTVPYDDYIARSNAICIPGY